MEFEIDLQLILPIAFSYCISLGDVQAWRKRARVLIGPDFYARDRVRLILQQLTHTLNHDRLMVVEAFLTRKALMGRDCVPRCKA